MFSQELEIFSRRFGCFMTALFLSGCSLLIGNIGPTDKKSNFYEIIIPNNFAQNWKIESHKTNEDTENLDYIYTETHSQLKIAINSTCNETLKDKKIHEVSEELLLNLNQSDFQSKNTITINNWSGIETIFHEKRKGKLYQNIAVTIKSGACVFDIFSININDSDFHSFKKFLNFFFLKDSKAK